MTVKIRALRASDRARWEDLFRAYIAFYEAEVADDVIAGTFRALLSGHAGSHVCFVAVDTQDKPIGLAHMLFHRSTWSRTGYVYLEDLFVDPAARAGGVGEALIRRVMAEADRLGATRTYWTTQESNARARRLYDKLATRAPFVQYRR